MKSSTRVAVLAALGLAAAACVRLDTPEKKDGYAVGHQIGESLQKIRDKVDLDQLEKGLADEAAGSVTLSDADRQQILSGLQAQSGPATDPLKAGYAVGVTLGQNVKGILDFADLNMIEKGIKDDFAGKSLLSDDVVRTALQDLDQRRDSILGSKNKALGEAYLAKNKALPGVMVTASGLEYQVLSAGSGRHPKATDTVNVDYIGTLVDGTKFDSSYDRHQPAVFELDRVIPGWTEGLQLMRPGAKYRFVIPANLAYGERGPAQIGPDSTLIFEVTLHSVQGGK